jgi:uncharacterized protein YrrD
MRFDLGTHVYTEDGHQVGKIDRIVLAESGGAVQSLVVHKGHFFTRDVLVPLDTIATVNELGVYLRLSRDQVGKLPDFVEAEYAPPPAGTPVPVPSTAGEVLYPLGVELGVAPQVVGEATNLPLGTGDIARGFNVVCADGEVGLVRDVVMEGEQATGAYLVLEASDTPLDHARVPLGLVVHVEDEVVTLRCTRDELRAVVARSTPA